MTASLHSFARRMRRTLLRLHRDQRGSTMLETLLILGMFVIPLVWLLLPVLWNIMQDYYLSFSYCVGWPFL